MTLLADQLPLVEVERDTYWCPRNCKRRCSAKTCACPVCFCDRCKRSAAIAASGRLYSKPEDVGDDAVSARVAYQPRLFTERRSRA